MFVLFKIHVNAQNVGMEAFDPTQPLTGVAGIPVNMTGMASRLGEAGYTHRVFAGKADFGMAHHEQVVVTAHQQKYLAYTLYRIFFLSLRCNLGYRRRWGAGTPTRSSTSST